MQRLHFAYALLLAGLFLVGCDDTDPLPKDPRHALDSGLHMPHRDSGTGDADVSDDDAGDTDAGVGQDAGDTDAS